VSTEGNWGDGAAAPRHPGRPVVKKSCRSAWPSCPRSWPRATASRLGRPRG